MLSINKDNFTSLKKKKGKKKEQKKNMWANSGSIRDVGSIPG